MSYSSNNKEQDPRSPSFDLGQLILTAGANRQNTWNDINPRQESDTSGRKWTDDNTNEWRITTTGGDGWKTVDNRTFDYSEWQGKPLYYTNCSYCGLVTSNLFEDGLCRVCFKKMARAVHKLFGDVIDGKLLYGYHNTGITITYSGNPTFGGTRE